MSQVQIVQPEAYYLEKSDFVPNNRVPALVYRNVLPRPLSRESAKVLCEGNHWEKRVSHKTTIVYCIIRHFQLI